MLGVLKHLYCFDMLSMTGCYLHLHQINFRQVVRNQLVQGAFLI